MSPQVRGPLAGKVAIVTGGGQGIGAAVCVKLAEQGARVGILDIRFELAGAIAARICDGRPDPYPAAIALQADVSASAALFRAVEEVVRRFGRIDALVNSAIWARYAPLEDMNEKMLSRMVATGFCAVLWGMQAVVPQMRIQGCGSIVNIGSAAGLLGVPEGIAYSGIKAGVGGLTRSAAAELGPYGIRVNTVAPGPVLTPGASANIDEEGMTARLARTPLRRLATPDDVASAVCFLVSDAAAFVSGQTVAVDGGLTTSLV
ncbi:MAG TPA: glucose 1-dehydrogenase [Ramlibacter sp.]|nr:glucose 1-dehydrogenase [Ramlibacter sp.]